VGRKLNRIWFSNAYLILPDPSDVSSLEGGFPLVDVLPLFSTLAARELLERLFCGVALMPETV
jgi:hypothetical protein